MEDGDPGAGVVAVAARGQADDEGWARCGGTGGEREGVGHLLQGEDGAEEEKEVPVLDATRARVADTVAKAVSLQGPLASALLQAGLSSAEVLAMRAQAWRWLDQCNQLGQDANSIALALLRLSATFTLTPVHADICLRLLPTWPELHSMECRLVITLWTERSNQAPHFRLEPPQPLARPAVPPPLARPAPSRRRWRGLHPPGAVEVAP